MKASVLSFLKNPENSSELPGKKDASSKGIKKYALNDTVSHLYRKYVEENPTVKISRATFARLRPRWMKTISVAARRQCLCMYHQNGQLLLKAVGESMSVNAFLKEKSADDIRQMLSELPHGNISFSLWEKEDIVTTENVIKKLRLHKVEMQREEFMKTFEDEFSSLREHVRRVHTQYEEISKLRKNLPLMTSATCQMDYSENFNVVYQDEPSQVFYDRRQVSIHPMVVHYRDMDGVVSHESFVGISEEKAHGAPTTAAFISKLIPEVLKILPDLKCIHYITDSPSSQYRNKSVIKLISQHTRWYEGVLCTWEFLETGHGKGPCDGVGGGVKKAAENAVKSGKVISSAKELFEWGEKYDGNMKFVFVAHGDVKRFEQKLNNAQYVKGVSKCHSLRPHNQFIWMRETSCFNPCCWEAPTCPGWEKTVVKICSLDKNPVEPSSGQVDAIPMHEAVPSTSDVVDAAPTDVEVPSLDVEVPSVEAASTSKDVEVPSVEAASTSKDVEVPSVEAASTSEDVEVPSVEAASTSEDVEGRLPSESKALTKWKVGMMVKAKYQGKVYVGKIKKIAEEAQDSYISFTKKTRGNIYVWPARKDAVWVYFKNIVKEVQLSPDGKLIEE